MFCSKCAFCRKLILRTFCNGTSKQSLTSKPSLTIALKILKTIEKPLTPMVGPSKNIQWWWSNVAKTIEKPLTSMVAWKKNINHSIALKNWPSLWSRPVQRNLLVRCNVFYFTSAAYSTFDQCNVSYLTSAMYSTWRTVQNLNINLLICWLFQLHSLCRNGLAVDQTSESR